MSSDVPAYPRHLTPAERQAVAEKAARDMVAAMPGATDRQRTDREIMQAMGELTVKLRWATERINALEGGRDDDGRD